MTVYLQIKEAPVIPIEAEVITPRHFMEVGEREIGSLDVHQDNRTLPLNQSFRIEGELGPSVEAAEIVVRGDTGKVKMIGKGMDGGRIRVEGDAGMCFGAEMNAGRIQVLGSVGAWAGTEMRDGNVQIEGNACEYLCSAYRGSRDGMQGGRVFGQGMWATKWHIACTRVSSRSRAMLDSMQHHE